MSLHFKLSRNIDGGLNWATVEEDQKMAYKVITGWSGNAGAEFHDVMTSKVKHYENWDRNAVEDEIFSRCETRLGSGETLDYEISKHHTVSGQTELVFFDATEFEISEEE